MKYLKMLGLAAVAAAALMAFVGASTASATVLCSTTTTPCNSTLPLGTRIGFESESSSIVKETGANGSTLDTCERSIVTGELTSVGGASSNPRGPITTFDWEKCTWTTTTIALGKLEVTGPLTGTSNGTVKSDAEVKWTTSIPLFGSCVYGFIAGVSLGTLTEGNPATIDINAVITRLSGSAFACPQTANWSATYVAFEPANTTIAVEPS